MAKGSGVAWVCNGCGIVSAKWQGQCPNCGAWNTLEETAKRSARPGTRLPSEARRLSEVATTPLRRLYTGSAELDRALGGGFIPGSSVVLGGHPGAGKSTLLLQVASKLSLDGHVLYVSGEESLEQIAARAARLGIPKDQLLVAAETDVSAVCKLMSRLKPKLVIVDSIQVMSSAEWDSPPGSVTQVRESAQALNQVAKSSGAAVVMVGHINKNDGLAGPMTLNHLVDVTLMLSSSEDSRFRFLRATKNRFGAVNELGVFAMTEKGMRDVKNPSAMFLNRVNVDAPGSIVTVLWEGTRPLLVEVQGLADAGAVGNPRRVAVGIDGTRLSMLLAILHRHGGAAVHDSDVYLNIVGGIRVGETAADLAILLSIDSSLRDRVIPPDTIAFGEVGLAGEVRPSSNGQERLREAAKHGFRTAIVPRGNVSKDQIDGIRVLPVSSLREALAMLWEQEQVVPPPNGKIKGAATAESQ